MQWSVVVKRLFLGDVLCRGRAFSRCVDGEVLQLLRAGDVCKAAFCIRLKEGSCQWGELDWSAGGCVAVGEMYSTGTC